MKGGEANFFSCLPMLALLKGARENVTDFRRARIYYQY